MDAAAVGRPDLLGGLRRTTIVAGKRLAPGKATVRFIFAYDGGGPGKGGLGTLYVNGEKVAEGRIEHTEARSKFTGHIPKVTVEVK